MKRREFISVVGGAMAAWSSASRAQQAAMPLIGFLSSFTNNPRFVGSFRKGLAEAGYIEGQNVAIEYRWMEGGQYDQLPAAAVDLANQRVSVIVASPIPAALAAKAATATVPIVFAIGSDPVETGLVASLNRPGANITGVSFLVVAVGAKRLALLRDFVPDASSVALLVNPSNPNAEPQIKDTQSATAELGLRLDVLRASSKDDFGTAFEALVRQRAGALFVSADPFFVSRRDELIALAARHGVPTMYFAREFTAAGGLMSYGSSFAAAYQQAGNYAGRILRGAKPGDLPVILSEKFEFVINLKTARGLGLEVPSKLLALADEVIE